MALYKYLTHFTRLGKSPRFAEQSIFVTGFGSKLFEEAWKNIDFVHDRVSAMGDGVVIPYERLLFKEHWPMIQMSNRYFTPQKAVMHESLNAFPPTIDPMGHLANTASSTDSVHIKENEVRYYEMKETMEGDKKYVTFSYAYITD